MKSGPKELAEYHAKQLEREGRIREHPQLLLPPAPDSKRKREPHMNTSFKPSEFDKQAAASLDMMDEKAAAERVQRILHPEAVNSGGIAKALKEAQAGPTLTPAPQTHPVSPKTPTVTVSDGHGGQFTVADPHLEEFPKQRKKRSDAGIPKKPPADPDEIVLRMNLDMARRCALHSGSEKDWGLAEMIQDQIIQQLQRRLDQLQKAPK